MVASLRFGPAGKSKILARCLLVVTGLWLIAVESPAQLFVGFPSYAHGRGKRCVMHQGVQDQVSLTGTDLHITFGRHKGKSYGDVVKEDPDYVLWLWAQSQQDDNTNEALLRFVNWAEDNVQLLEDSLLAQEKMNAERMDGNAVSFGKYQGMSYSQVVQEDPDYALWAMEQAQTDEAPQGMCHFAKWAEENRALVEQATETVNFGGKHQGKSYADVLQEDPEYLLWAMQAQAATPGLRRFAQWAEENRALVEQTTETVNFGSKHQGKSYADLLQEEPDYLLWAMQQQAATPGLRRLAQWAEENRASVDEAMAGLEEKRRLRQTYMDSNAMSFGKYQGMSYSQVVQEDPDYALWAMEQAQTGDASQQVRHFAKWAEESGFSAEEAVAAKKTKLRAFIDSIAEKFPRCAKYLRDAEKRIRPAGKRWHRDEENQEKNTVNTFSLAEKLKSLS